MFEVIREVTDWAPALNHTYLVEGDLAMAYVRNGTRAPVYFNTPIRLDKRRRKFVKGNVALFPDLPTNSHIVEVTGSRGTYYVNTSTKKCTCPGFKFRGRCKHVTEVEKA